MVVTTRSLKIKIKKSDNPIESFLNNVNKTKNLSIEIDFIRYIGMDSSETDYVSLIKKIDDYFLCYNPQIPYLRIDRLETVYDPDILKTYTSMYDTLNLVSQQKAEDILKAKFPFTFQDDTYEWTQKKAFLQVLDMYKKNTPNVSESMVRNFGIKLMNWMSTYFNLLFKESEHKQKLPKVVFVGNIKLQEFLFLYFLSLLGCDILYMNSERDIDIHNPEFENLSVLYKCKSLQKCSVQIPDYNKYKSSLTAINQQVKTPINGTVNDTPIQSSVGNSLNFFDNRGRSSINFDRPNKNKNSQQNTQNISTSSNVSNIAKKELSYEELARMSNSVVMIKVYDNKLTHYKSGSGVVINNSGYILTNFHVVCGGHGYAVQFENEEQVYTTQELIKYHDGNDLAIIRVSKNCRAVSLYSGKNIVRGQKIVAIGSPLGLFNTISDGIVSGFRKIQDKSMIQFTAPISNGSSGGALLDMYGRLIGIITAGYDEGQNLNLAVDSETILSFANNFITQTN